MRAQHEQEFSEYADARWPVLVRAAVVLGCSLEEAQDLAQTTLLRCLRAWTRVRAADDRDAYVYTVLLNAHRDSHRRRWRGERPTAEVPDSHVADRSAEVDLTDAVHRALADLSADHRAVVVLRHLAGLDERRTAEVLGVAPGTVKSRLSRAMDRLSASTHLADLAPREQS